MFHKFNIKCFTTTSGKIESERIVTYDRYVTFGDGELLAYHSFCWKTTKPIPTPVNLEEAAGSVFVQTHSTDTRHRASTVTRQDDQEVTAIKNGKLARSQEQNSPTDMSECTFWKSTRFKSCTALKRPKKKKIEQVQDLTLITFVDTACFCGGTAKQSRKVSVVALSKDHNLNDFKSILTLPPTGRIEGPVVVCDSCQTNIADFIELRSHNDCFKTMSVGENRFIFYSEAVFLALKNKKIQKLQKIITSTIKFPGKPSDQSWR